MSQPEVTRYPVHLCLVSDQPVPNLVPACDPEFRPRKIYLLLSQDKLRQAENLEAVYREQKLDSERWFINDPYDFSHVRLRLEKLLTRFDPGEIALNATGGTKIMTLAAYEVFHKQDRPVFHVNPYRDTVTWVHPKRDPQEIPDRLGIEDFLAVHGYRVTSARRYPIAPHRQALGKQLITRHRDFEKGLGALNYLAGTAEDDPVLRSRQVEERNWRSREFGELLDLFSEENLLTEDAGRLRFAREEDRFFVNGGWLEEYLFDKVGNLQLQDAAMSVTVETPLGTKNEIDLALLHNNQLYLIECKTRRFYSGKAGSQALYKLDCLRDLGGVMTKTMLVSYNKLGQSDSRRAADLGITVVTGGKLRNIEERLQKWLTGQS